MLNTQVYDEAAQWFVRQRDGNLAADGQRAFAAWLRTSPEHVRAYLEITAIWTDVPGVRAEHTGDAATLIERARNAANVVGIAAAAADVTETAADINELAAGINEAAAGINEAAAASREDGSRAATPAPTVQRSQQLSRPRLAVAASLLVMLAAGALLWWQTQRGIYATDIGEQHSVALPDGSTLELNSSSRVRMRFTAAERRIDLIEGQALFSVAQDAQRPFVVRSNTASVRALGTVFDVYRRTDGTVVTVLEGKVRVDSAALEGAGSRRAGSPPAQSTPHEPRAGDTGGRGDRGGERARLAPVELIAGEQVLVRATGLESARRVNVSAATAWTERQLVFESASLSEVAEEFNRYNPRRIVLRGAPPDAFRISAVFSSTDPGSLVRFLREQPGLQVKEADDAIYVDIE